MEDDYESVAFPYGNGARTDDLTYAGALDHSFSAYANAIRNARMTQHQPPLRYANEPSAYGDMTPDLLADGPYMGTIGAFHATIAVNPPTGPWLPEYGGTLPLSMQPQLSNTEPWLNPDGQ